MRITLAVVVGIAALLGAGNRGGSTSRERRLRERHGNSVASAQRHSATDGGNDGGRGAGRLLRARPACMVVVHAGDRHRRAGRIRPEARSRAPTSSCGSPRDLGCPGCRRRTAPSLTRPSRRSSVPAPRTTSRPGRSTEGSRATSRSMFRSSRHRTSTRSLPRRRSRASITRIPAATRRTQRRPRATRPASERAAPSGTCSSRPRTCASRWPCSRRIPIHLPTSRCPLTREPPGVSLSSTAATTRFSSRATPNRTSNSMHARACPCTSWSGRQAGPTEAPSTSLCDDRSTPLCRFDAKATVDKAGKLTFSGTAKCSRPTGFSAYVTIRQVFAGRLNALASTQVSTECSPTPRTWTVSATSFPVSFGPGEANVEVELATRATPRGANPALCGIRARTDERP